MRQLLDQGDVVSAHQFFDPLSQSEVILVVGDDRESTGVVHEGCDELAAVAPELDCASCSRCHWQARISGAWFMDLWRARPLSDYSGDDRT